MSQWHFELENEVRRPTQISVQFSLFPDQRDDVLAKARVSMEDMAQW